ncbi:MAG: Hydrogenase, membrane subunit 3-like protein (EchB-like) [Candidatus Peregrinibacteria bacterium Gr01-1014_25]|nr:MAG: Hydrogenase, membrane subunit 3-like protein (EchB-like) [Candidatus Peregrinibacteria bacterium Gr01-1014_25]
MSVFVFFLQGTVVLLLAPLATGCVRWCKARFQGRHGASPFLPYVRFLTLLRKEMVIAETASWIFHAAPFVVLCTAVFVAFSLPLLTSAPPPGGLDNFILFAAILALGSVFLVLGGLDPGTAFGGMGASREMTLASLVEPAMITALAAFAVVSDNSAISGMLAAGGASLLQHPALVLSLVALGLVALAENARYPVDNPATHLELTMVHEAMILEYSGAYLAIIELASSIRLTVFALLLANLLVPFPLLATAISFSGALATIGATVAKLVIAMFLLALWESSIPKMRFYRMQEYLSGAFFIALAGLAFSLLSLP